MSATQAALRALIRELHAGVAPVPGAAATPAGARQMLGTLGYDPPKELLTATDATGALSSALDALHAAATRASLDVGGLADALISLWNAVDSMIDAYADVLDTEDLSSELDDFRDALERLPPWLLIQRLDTRLPLLTGALRLLGVIDRDGDAPVEVFRRDRFQALVDDPVVALGELYGWDKEGGVDGARLLDGVRRLLHLLGVIPSMRDLPVSLRGGSTDPAPRGIDLDLFYDPSTPRPVRAGVYVGPTQDRAGWMLAPYSVLEESDVELGAFRFTLPTELAELAFGLAWSPEGFDVVGEAPDAVSFAIEATKALQIGHGASPLVTVQGTRLALELLLGDDPDVSLDVDTGTIVVNVDLTAEKGMFSELLGGSFSAQARGRLSWKASEELTLDLGLGAELLIAARPQDDTRDTEEDEETRTRRSPLQLRYLRLRLAAEATEEVPPKVQLDAGITVALTLGPAEVTLGGLGLAAVLTTGHGKGARGNLGPAHLDIEVLKPDAIGLVIETDAVSGGGYLRWSEQRYEGALQLTLGEIQLSALGLLETGDPWSLLALVGARFPGLPLGFGVKLTGIGGLVAVHRDMDLDALKAGARSGRLTTLLGPDELNARAPEILATLDGFFPKAPGRFAGGLFVNLTWGPDDLWTTDLGVFLSVPRPIKIALVGSSRLLKLTPAGDAKTAAERTMKDELFAIRLDVLGTYDGSLPEITVDAVLLDSHIASLPLEGGAHFRWRGGSNPDFVLTVGGFHPDFSPPLGTTVPDRVRFGIEKPRFALTFEAYVALTPNTLQFGAALTLLAEALGLLVRGGFSIDVLIQFRPFGFQTDLAAWFELSTAKGRSIASIQVAGSLSGPKPWAFAASVSIKILGLKVEGQVAAELGDKGDAEPPAQPADVITLTRDRLDEDAAWTVQRRDRRLVLADEDAPILLPLDTLAAAQELAPLGERLEHLNGQPLAGTDAVTLGLRCTESAVTATEIRAPFAPASWARLTDAERITAPGFAPGQAGLALGVSTTTSSASRSPTGGTHEHTLLDGTGTLPSSPHGHVPARRRVA